MKESIQQYIDHIEQEHDDQDTLLHNNRLSRELEKRAKLRGLRVARLSGVFGLVAFGEGFSSQVKPGVMRRLVMLKWTHDEGNGFVSTYQRRACTSGAL